MRIPTLLFAALSLEATLTAREKERQIERADLPSDVKKTVAAQIGPAHKLIDHEE